MVKKYIHYMVHCIQQRYRSGVIDPFIAPWTFYRYEKQRQALMTEVHRIKQQVKFIGWNNRY